jgi:hypothetical protein
MQELEAAVAMLGQRRAALDPVAVVAVQHVVHHAHLRAVDVAADQAVDPLLACRPGDRVLEVADVLHGILDPVLEEGSQRPVAVAEYPAECVQVAVQPKIRKS